MVDSVVWDFVGTGVDGVVVVVAVGRYAKAVVVNVDLGDRDRRCCRRTILIGDFVDEAVGRTIDEQISSGVLEGSVTIGQDRSCCAGQVERRHCDKVAVVDVAVVVECVPERDGAEYIDFVLVIISDRSIVHSSNGDRD